MKNTKINIEAETKDCAVYELSFEDSIVRAFENGIVILAEKHDSTSKYFRCGVIGNRKEPIWYADLLTCNVSVGDTLIVGDGIGIGAKNPYTGRYEILLGVDKRVKTKLFKFRFKDSDGDLIPFE